MKKAAVLTLFSFICRALGMLLRVYLSNRIGAEGMGLYQLVMSVYTLFATFATAGFSVAVSRLVAEHTAKNPDTDIARSDGKRTLYSAMLIAFVMSMAAGVFMYGLADKLSVFALKDTRTVLPLKILAVSMPFMAVSSCMKGYFLAIRNVYKPSIASLFEECVKISVMLMFFTLLFEKTTDVGIMCVGVVTALTVSEVMSFVLLAVMYRFFTNNRTDKYLPSAGKRVFIYEILGVTIPIALSAYVTSLLHTVENILIPSQFEKFGGDSQTALAEFGLIRGMVIPIIFFPFAFLGALIAITLPEISRLNISGDRIGRNAKIKKLVRSAYIFGIASAAIFYFFAEPIGKLLYNTTDTVYSMKMLSLVLPFMYVETVCDAILKTVGEQKRALLYTVLNSVLRIAVILLFIPLAGAKGYIWLLLISNTFAYMLCYVRVRKNLK